MCHRNEIGQKTNRGIDRANTGQQLQGLCGAVEVHAVIQLGGYLWYMYNILILMNQPLFTSFIS